MEKVSWHEAVAYCNALSDEKGYDKCYTCTGSGSTVTCTESTTRSGAQIYSCPGYRLPTEAEWEYAYRAGTTTAFYSGANDSTACSLTACIENEDANAEKIAWYRANSTATYEGCQTDTGCPCQGPHPVGQKQKNDWGLYDMAGNVYEWCHDWFQDGLGFSAVTDPWGPSSGTHRVWRGGAWHCGPDLIRAAMRVESTPGNQSQNIGFRCARTLPNP